MEFCDETGCMEFAQSDDPECDNTLKFKCAAHEATARRRGETGIRRDWESTSMFENFSSAIAAVPVREKRGPGRPRKVDTEPPVDPPPADEPPAPEPPAEVPAPPAPAEPVITTPEEKPMPRGGANARVIQEIDAGGLVVCEWSSLTACEMEVAGKITNCLRRCILEHGGDYKGRKFRFADGSVPVMPRPVKASKPAKSIAPQQVPAGEIIPSQPSATPADGHPLLSVLSAIAAMAIGTRELVLSDLELEAKSATSTIIVRIKSVTLQASPSSALVR